MLCSNRWSNRTIIIGINTCPQRMILFQIRLWYTHYFNLEWEPLLFINEIIQILLLFHSFPLYIYARTGALNTNNKM